jgi:hypothetical protein
MQTHAETQPATPTEATPTEAVVAFFERYGAALTSPDLPAVAACYATPGLIVSDERSIAIGSRAEVRAAFCGVAEACQAKRLVAAVPTVRSAQRLTSGLVLAAVDWEYVDNQGGAVAGESNHYLLRMLDTGPLICVVTPAG